MPPLTTPQLALLRGDYHRSLHYLFPFVAGNLLSARVNDGAITVGARVITFDMPTGDWTLIQGGETLYVGNAAGAHDVGILRVISATATTLTVSENSDVAWADNLYLTVKQEYLVWPKRHRLVAGVKKVDYDVAYSDQTDKWPPVAMMGDPCVKLFVFGVDPSPTVFFSGAESYAMAPSATITNYAWVFPGGSPATSTAAIPGLVTYALPGVFWTILTVTDSNGKTATTKRPIGIIDTSSGLPAAGVHVDFEIQSCEVSIDGVLRADFKVFGSATLAMFPERSPIGWLRDDWYQRPHGSVGFPPDREHMSLFGYIGERSVRKDPYTNEITFTLVNTAGVMQAASTYPVFVQDKASPASWDDAKKLTIRRSLFYLLKFHSTVFEVSDVELPTDTTPIRKSDFPENNLWAQYDTFARVARGERTGITKTGRLVTRRDPQLIPEADRLTNVAAVCQLVKGDWINEVTWKETDWPNVSILDLWGVTYDAVPADESNPVHSIAPGNPYRDFGSQDGQQYMQLNGQLDGNAYAGLMLGQRNYRYTAIIIELGGNWWNCFDPALQEYVQAPVLGFDTREGLAMLANAYLIVRTIRMKQQWGTGYFSTELECEVATAPELSVTGDYPVNVSDPPDGCPEGEVYDPDTATCIVPDPPPCVGASLGIGFTTDPPPVDGVVRGDAPLIIDFTNTSTGADAYLWDFGDGDTSTDDDPLKEFDNAGTYHVKLTAYNDCLSNSIEGVFVVDYHVDFDTDVTSGCGPLAVAFTSDIAGGTVLSVEWHFGDGGVNFINLNPTHTYISAGSRVAKLSVTFVGGTIVSASHTITVNDCAAVLSAFAVSDSEIDLSWTDATSGYLGYSVWRSLTGVGSWVLAGVTGPNVTTFADTGLDAGTTYYYRVKATTTETHPYSNVASDTTSGGGSLSVFTVDFDTNNIYNLTAVSAGGGSGSEITGFASQFGLSAYLDGVAAGTGTKLSAIWDDGTDDIHLAYSTDNGATWTDSDTSIADIAGTRPRVIDSDSTNRDLMWAVTDADLSILHAFYSTDSGANWTHVTLHDYTGVAGYTHPSVNARTSIVLPREDNTYTYIVHMFAYDPYPTFQNDFYRLKNDGTFTRVVTTGLPDTDHFVAYQTLDPTQLDTLWLIVTKNSGQVNKLAKFVWPGTAISIIGTLGSGSADRFRSIFCTSAGTLLVYDFDNAQMWRSTNGGSSWSQIDISTPLAGSRLDYGHGMVESGGNLISPILNGTYLFSTDDGVTWSATANLSGYTDIVSNTAR